VYHACNDYYLWGQIKDCSNMSPHGCSKTCKCGYEGTYPNCYGGYVVAGWNTPRVEVTSTFFEDLGGDLDCDGRVAASVYA